MGLPRNRGRTRRADGSFLPKGPVDEAEITRQVSAPHRFQPGKSGNAGGRAPGERELRQKIADLTGNGEALIEMLHSIAFGLDDTMTDQRVRFAALELMIEHFYGKVKQTVAVSGPGQVTPEQVAMVLALQLSPHERRSRIADLKSRVAVSEAKPADPDEAPQLTNGHGDVDAD